MSISEKKTGEERGRRGETGVKERGNEGRIKEGRKGKYTQ
jgi:hypothetical protein